MDPRLERALSVVAASLRRVRFLWLLSIAWIFLAAAAGWMWLGGATAAGGSGSLLGFLFFGAIIAVVGAWSVSQMAYRNGRALARMVRERSGSGNAKDLPRKPPSR